MQMFSAQGFVIDIESSGLSCDSYPIQIGWCSLDLSRYGNFLVRPDCSWTEWDERAEAIHGIDRGELDAGLSVSQACRTLIDLLYGHRVYCDSPAFDQFWIDRLFIAGGWPDPQFSLLHIVTLAPKEFAPVFITELESRTRSHNALHDARLIASIALRPQFYGRTDD